MSSPHEVPQGITTPPECKDTVHPPAPAWPDRPGTASGLRRRRVSYFTLRKQGLARSGRRSRCPCCPGAELANEPVSHHGSRAAAVSSNTTLLLYVSLHSIALAAAVFTPRVAIFWAVLPTLSVVAFFGVAVWRYIRYGKPDDPAFASSWVNAMLGFEADAVMARNPGLRASIAFRNAKARGSKLVNDGVELPKDRLVDTMRSLLVGHITPALFPLVWMLCLATCLISILYYHFAVLDDDTDASVTVFQFGPCSERPTPNARCHVLAQFSNLASAVTCLLGLFLMFTAAFETSDSTVDAHTTELVHMAKKIKAAGPMMSLLLATLQDEHPDMFVAHSLPPESEEPKAGCCGSSIVAAFQGVVQGSIDDAMQQAGDKLDAGTANEHVESMYDMVAAGGAGGAGGAAVLDVAPAGGENYAAQAGDAAQAALQDPAVVLKIMTFVTTLNRPMRVLLSLVAAYWPFTLLFVREHMPEACLALVPATATFFMVLITLETIVRLVQEYTVSLSIVRFMGSKPLLSVLMLDQRIDRTEYADTELPGILEGLPDGPAVTKWSMSRSMERLKRLIPTLHEQHPVYWYQFRTYAVDQLVAARNAKMSYAVAGLTLAMVVAVAGTVVSVYVDEPSFLESLTLMSSGGLLFFGSAFLLRTVSVLTEIYTAQQSHVAAVKKSRLYAEVATVDCPEQRRPKLFLSLDEHFAETISKYDTMPKVLGIRVDPTFYRVISGYLAVAFSSLMARIFQTV